MKRTFLYIALAIFFASIPAAAHAAITLDTFATSSRTLSIGNFTINKSITTGGSNEILIVHVSFGSGGTITATTTVDGSTANVTQYVNAKSGGGSNQQFSWYVTGLSSGAHSVTTTMSGTNSVAVTMGLTSYDGVATVNPIDTSSTNPSSASVSPTTVSITTSGSNEMIDEFLSTNNQINSDTGVGQTDLYFNILNSGNGRMASSYLLGSTATTYTLGWNLNATSNQWVESAIALVPFVAPASGASNANTLTLAASGPGIFNCNSTFYELGINFLIQ